MARSSKTLKAITTEAKLIRKSKPTISWQSAIKQASKFYNDTIKPTAKKVVSKTKRVAKATAKGYAVAKRSYAKSKVGASRSYTIDEPLIEDLFLYMESEPIIMRRYENDYLPNVARKVGAGKLNKALLPKLFEYLYKNNLTTIKKFYGNINLNPAERKMLAQMWSDKAIDDLSGNYDKLYNGRTGKYEPIEKFTKGNLIGKVSSSRLSSKKTAGRTGSGKRIGIAKVTRKKATKKKVLATKKGVKPIKPTFKILDQQNNNWFKNYIWGKKLIVYSPILNEYIVVTKGKGRSAYSGYIVYNGLAKYTNYAGGGGAGYAVKTFVRNEIPFNTTVSVTVGAGATAIGNAGGGANGAIFISWS